MERKYYIHLIGAIIFISISAFLAAFVLPSNTEYVVNEMIHIYNADTIVDAICSMFYFYFGLGVIWFIMFRKGYRNFCVFMDGFNDERRKNKKKNSCKNTE